MASAPWRQSGFWRSTVIAIQHSSKGIWRVGKRPACLWKSSFVTGRNMAVAGIDVGSQSTKVVILEGDRILAAVTLQTGESGESEARQTMEEALRKARLKLDDMKSVV